MQDCTELRPGERVDDLQRGSLRIIQNERLFRFGTDAVLLSDFALIKPRARVMDLGTGTGVIALLVAARHPDARIEAVELQPYFAELAQRNVDLNALNDRIFVHEMDMRLAAQKLGYGRMDQVICNPPYFEQGSSLLPESENKLLSRMDASIGIDEITRIAFALLKSGGRFSVVFPAQRLCDLLFAMQNARLAPKRIRSVHATLQHAPKLVLVDAVKQGGSQMHWLPPLILKNPDGTNTPEWERIYGE
ncbi:MAG: tRNA1(Val) (adenine(37)-N6)-methyltransferase [Clostridia bacterium]|nr:tRNA1(Val) (adenine(37)-N6)-methyltransferase [Clostridia bacterium]